MQAQLDDVKQRCNKHMREAAAWKRTCVTKVQEKESFQKALTTSRSDENKYRKKFADEKAKSEQLDRRLRRWEQWWSRVTMRAPADKVWEINNLGRPPPRHVTGAGEAVSKQVAARRAKAGDRATRD